MKPILTYTHHPLIDKPTKCELILGGVASAIGFLAVQLRDCGCSHAFRGTPQLCPARGTIRGGPLHGLLLPTCCCDVFAHRDPQVFDPREKVGRKTRKNWKCGYRRWSSTHTLINFLRGGVGT